MKLYLPALFACLTLLTPLTASADDFPPPPVAVPLPVQVIPPAPADDFPSPEVPVAADTPPPPVAVPAVNATNILAPATVVDEFPFYTNDHTLANWRKYLENGGDVEKPDNNGTSALMQAAGAGNVALCELLIKHGADVNYVRPSDKMTPLMWAARESREVCELLLKHGAKRDAADEYGNAAFHYIQHEHEDVLQFFLDAGVDIDLQNENSGDTLLIRSASHSPERVKMVLAKKPNVNLANNHGQTALHMAVEFMNPEQSAEAVRMLLAAGAEVNAQNTNGETPLYICVRHYRIKMDVFDMLLKAGADVNLGRGENHHRGMPLEMALENGHVDAVMKMLDARADITQRHEHGAIPLFLAAKTWSRSVMERLIKMGADIHERNSPAEETVLMAVAEAGDVETAKWLLEQGAELNDRSRWGKTAVMKALECRQDEMVRFLVEKGADLTEGDAEKQQQRGGYVGQPLLHAVVERGDLEMTRLLVKHGARFLDEERDQKKLLHCAVQSGNAAMCEYILNFNSDVNVRDYAGNTALHNAASDKNYDLCVLLLSRGAKVNARNNNQQTPLMRVVLADSGHGVHDALRELRAVRAWRLLVEAGAEVDAQDDQEKTVMDYVFQVGPGAVALGMSTPFAPIPPQVPWSPGEKPARVIGTVNDTSGELLRASFFTKYVETSTGRWRDAAAPESLFMAAHEGDADRVKRLLDAGQDVNRRDRDGETALHFAVRAGRAEMVKFLLDNNADINAQGIHCGMPIHYAAALGEREILELLLARGVDVNVRHAHNDRALHWAVAASQGPCVIALVRKGADAAVFGSHYSPLTLALKMRKETYCKFFCDNGLNLETHMKERAYYLHFDAMGLAPEHVRILLACGMDINVRDYSGTTLLHYAVNRNELPLVAFLIKHGANPTLKDSRGKTPLEMVTESGNPWFMRRQMEKMMENGKWRTENE